MLNEHFFSNKVKILLGYYYLKNVSWYYCVKKKKVL